MNGPYDDFQMPAGAALARASTGAKVMSIPERLRVDKEQLEERLEQVNAALKALDDNPEVARVVHLISKVAL